MGRPFPLHHVQKDLHARGRVLEMQALMGVGTIIHMTHHSLSALKLREEALGLSAMPSIASSQENFEMHFAASAHRATAGVNGLLRDCSTCGFCIFNNVAAGAKHALANEEVKRSLSSTSMFIMETARRKLCAPMMIPRTVLFFHSLI